MNDQISPSKDYSVNAQKTGMNTLNKTVRQYGNPLETTLSIYLLKLEERRSKTSY